MMAVFMVALAASIAVAQSTDPVASVAAPTGDSNESSFGIKERFAYATCITCIPPSLSSAVILGMDQGYGARVGN